MARVPASKQTRKQLEQLFDGCGAAEGDRGELVKLAARLIVEEALEEEVEDVIGRGYYAHGDESRGHRNGYRRGKLDSAEGRIEYAVPQVRGTLKPFQSAIREALGSRTEELERLAIEMYARGLSRHAVNVKYNTTNVQIQREDGTMQEMTDTSAYAVAVVNRQVIQCNCVINDKD